MKLDVTPTLKNLEGEDLKGEDKKELTLRGVIVGALTAALPEEQQSLTGDKKLKRYMLASKVQGALDAPNVGVVDLSIDDAKMIKDLVGRVWPTIVVGQAYQLLEAAE